MFRNYLKTALRNLLREKSNTAINLAGLTLGITCSLILFLMVKHLSSFDNFHTKRDRIYRIVTESQGNQGSQYTSGVPSVFPEAFRTDFPEAEQVVFTSYRDNGLVLIPKSQGEPLKFQEEGGIVFTEPGFFKVFDRTIITGDVLNGLDEPNEAIISKGWALRYFGKEDVIGAIVKFEDHEYKITAIMEDAPSNTDMPFELMLSYSTIKKVNEEKGWRSTWSNEQCYFLLREEERITSIESRLPAFAKKYLGDNDVDQSRFMTQSLKDMHYDERFDTYTYSTISRGMITAFAVIALILVVTACINFINLATAEAIKRSKEVGVRKSLGSSRGQLVRQFLGETTLVTLIAMTLALGCAQLTLAFLNPFLELNLTLDLANNTHLWGYIMVVTLLVSLLSGLYPSFVISGFKPVQALKNQINNRNSSGYALRKALVVAQFCISQLFIIGTIVIMDQMSFFQQKDLGFAKEAIIIVSIPEQELPAYESKGTSKMRTLRDQMALIPGVESVSLASTPPSSGIVSGTNFKIAGTDKDYSTQIKQVDGNYLDLYKLELVAGQNLEDTDTARGFVVNEKLVHTAGFQHPNDIVGKAIRLWGKDLPVVGVVKDFHTVSLHDPIEATVLMNRIRGYGTLSLKIDLRNTQAVIGQLKTKWEAAYPEALFDYHFLDENIREFYENEQRMSVLLTIFSSMAIFIGCLGLFGLATFMANQKNKEIGVRKVMGASVESIVLMFSREYLKLIAIGFLLAAPLAWFMMSRFLDEFAYKIELGPGIFFLGLAITLTIAAVTVGYRSIKAAVVNPVKSLRYE